MPRMKDCRECKANDIPRDEWDYANDGAYPVFTRRELKREHSYCGMRLASYGVDPNKIILTRRGGALIHKGGK